MNHRLVFFAANMLISPSCGFIPRGSNSPSRSQQFRAPLLLFLADTTNTAVCQPVDSIDGASKLLTEWDQTYNNKDDGTKKEPKDDLRQRLPKAVRFLSQTAAEQRALNPAQGRVMLGICASSAPQGVATLKSWVTSLELPRGLLHGMDEGGQPLSIDGGVYIKYNSGGVYTFSDIRKSGLGFDALWKPGDAMLENYDGIYRGVYFQVELEDAVFRQYLCPLDLFDEIP